VITVEIAPSFSPLRGGSRYQPELAWFTATSLHRSCLLLERITTNFEELAAKNLPTFVLTQTFFILNRHAPHCACEAGNMFERHASQTNNDEMRTGAKK